MEGTLLKVQSNIPNNHSFSFPLGNNAFTDFNSLVGYVEETVHDALKGEKQ